MNLSTYLLIGMALAPVVLLTSIVYYKDKHEKEPLRLLIVSFILGCVSVVPAIMLEVLAERTGLGESPFQPVQTFLHAFIGVALAEEFSKYIFLRGYLYKHKAFNEPYDGIMYAMMIGMGFAMTENLMYVFSGDSFGDSMRIAIIRALTAVPAHASFAVLMGFFAGLAKFNKKHAFVLLLTGLLTATLFHGAYDFFLMQAFYPGITAGAFVSLIIGIFLSLKAMKIHQKASPFKKEKK
jgi:protease PrsW